MLVNIKVYPHSRKKLIKQEGGTIKVYTNAPAIDNRANVSVVEMLAEFFGVSKSAVQIKKGEKSREKIIEIQGR